MTISLTSLATRVPGFIRDRKPRGWKIKNNNKQIENSVAIGSSYFSDFSSLCFKIFLISSLFIYTVK